MTVQSESSKFERLVAFCKLWNAIKYFHPYLAYRDDIDWDAALVTAVPKVRAAGDAGEFAAAVQEMLAALNDPVTRIIQQVSAHPVSPTPEHEPQPAYTLTSDGILIVAMNYYHDLADSIHSINRFEGLGKEIPKTRGIIFDFRARDPLPQEKGSLAFVFNVSEIATVVTTEPVYTPGERSRMHIGYQPHQGSASGNYASMFKVIDGRKILPAAGAKNVPAVFVVNARSELPATALALQIAGKAAIIVEGEISDASLVQTHRIPLGEEIIAEVRLNEVICPDGSGFMPDIIVPISQIPEDKDQAMVAALDLLNDFKPPNHIRSSLPACAVPPLDNSYPEMKLPSLEYRLLAAFRIWGVINYFFPYKDLMGEDWDGVLREFIPRMEEAVSALEYHQGVAEMITRIHDSHGGTTSPVLNEYFGRALPPIRMQMIEGLPVITTLLDEELVKKAGATYGDIVQKVDGEDVMERTLKRGKYLPASTPQHLMYRAVNSSLYGHENTEVMLTILDRDNKVKDIRLPRKAEYAIWKIAQRNGAVLRLISDEIGYADLDRLEMSMVDEMFEMFKNTQAIIFDVRGYPRGTVWEIAARLTDRSSKGAALFQPPVAMLPDGANGELLTQSFNYSFIQSIPTTNKWRYKGKTVMLMDERTISHAEHTGLFFETANGTPFIGTHTSGANGDVTNFCVPGGIMIGFTGQSVKHADGRQLQRIGLVPDNEIKPTIKGMQDGEDEILDGAIAYLQQEIGHNS